MSDNKPVISDEAVEAAAKVLKRRIFGHVLSDNQSEWEDDARAVLEAAAPILLSHERQLTADAHRDAIVNRDTVDRLERELQTAKADAWDEAYDNGFEAARGEPDTPNPYRSQP